MISGFPLNFISASKYALEMAEIEKKGVSPVAMIKFAAVQVSSSLLYL